MQEFGPVVHSRIIDLREPALLECNIELTVV